jgi:hypothetical protein
VRAQPAAYEAACAARFCGESPRPVETLLPRGAQAPAAHLALLTRLLRAQKRLALLSADTLQFFVNSYDVRVAAQPGPFPRAHFDACRPATRATTARPARAMRRGRRCTAPRRSCAGFAPSTPRSSRAAACTCGSSRSRTWTCTAS